MLSILFVLCVSFLILNVTLFTVATVIVFIPNFWGFALAVVGTPLFAAMVIGFFFLVAPNLSDTVELKTAFLACFIGFFSGIAGHFFIPDYIDLLGTQYVESVPVARASAHAGAGYRSFLEGELLADKAVHHVVHDKDSEGNPTKTRYSAAPVRPTPFHPGESIQLIAVAIGEPPFGRWVTESLPIQGMTVRADRHHRKTLSLLRESGVSVAGDPVLLRLEDRTYQDLLASKRLWSWVVTIAANLLWFLILLFWISASRIGRR